MFVLWECFVHCSYEVRECCVSDGPMVAGNVFSGTADWHSCQPWREHHLSLKITGVMTSKLFPARLGINAHVIADIPHENVSKPCRRLMIMIRYRILHVAAL